MRRAPDVTTMERNFSGDEVTETALAELANEFKSNPVDFYSNRMFKQGYTR